MYQLPLLGLLSLAMVVPLLTGGLNLAIIATTNQCALLMVFVMSSLITAETGGAATLGVIALALVAGLLLCLVIGLATGALVAYTGVHPILVTLGTKSLIDGISIYLTRGMALSGMPEPLSATLNATLLGMPLIFLLLIVVAIVIGVILRHTPFGVACAMIGSNVEATRYSAIDTRRVLVGVYVMSSVTCFFAALVMLAHLQLGERRLRPVLPARHDPRRGARRRRPVRRLRHRLRPDAGARHPPGDLLGPQPVRPLQLPDRRHLGRHPDRASSSRRPSGSASCRWRRRRPLSVVAVFDVGKTNAKLYAVAADGTLLETASTPNRLLDGPPYRHHDLAGLEALLLAALADFGRRHAIDAIVPCAHGGSGVLVGDDGPAMPMIDYEQPLPPAVATRLPRRGRRLSRARQQRHHARRRPRRPPAPLDRARLARRPRRRRAPSCRRRSTGPGASPASSPTR